MKSASIGWHISSLTSHLAEQFPASHFPGAVREIPGLSTKLAGSAWLNCAGEAGEPKFLFPRFVHGISCWDVELEGAIQLNLVITPSRQPTITVDNLEIAQLIYLLLNNTTIRIVIDTISSKVVLILGRFTDDRKKILDALREELRKRNYTPLLFDFEKPTNRDITETVSTLAHMARFVIADFTEPKSIPQELSHIVPFFPSVPIVSFLQASGREYGMYEHFISYPWIQPIYQYREQDELLQAMQEQIIDPTERKVRELAIEKAKRLERP